MKESINSTRTIPTWNSLWNKNADEMAAFDQSSSSLSINALNMLVAVN